MMNKSLTSCNKDNLPSTSLNHTCKTEYGDVKFPFDYSDNWKVSKSATQRVFIEEIILENDRGVTITYWQYLIFPLGGYGHTSMTTAEVKMVSNSSLDNFIVGKTQIIETIDMLTGEEHIVNDGRVSYALLARDDVGIHSGMVGYGGLCEEFSFSYGSSYYRMEAEAPGGEFTQEEEQEIIAILSSFRIAN